MHITQKKPIYVHVLLILLARGGRMGHSRRSLALFYLSITLPTLPVACDTCPPFTEQVGDFCIACDCHDNCFHVTKETGRVGDGKCDTRPNYNCPAYEFDGGDCEPTVYSEEPIISASSNTFVYGDIMFI